MTLERAIMIATMAHEGQLDKGGKPYILHPLAVMMKMSSEEERIVAVLHDVVEDTGITLEGLKSEGLSDEILEGIDLLTRKEGEKYWDYLKKLSVCRLASKVKMEDLEQNMDLSRLVEITEKDLERRARYQTYFDYLTRRYGFCPQF